MENRTKSILIFVLTLVLAGLVYVWYYPLDRGEVSISAGLPDYWVMASDLSVQCAADPCLITLKTGSRTITVRKDGYFPVTAESVVRRLKTESITVQLKKIPTLKESAVIPSEPISLENKPLPAELAKGSVLAPAWDAKGEKLAYVDLADDKVKIWMDGAARTVTPLANLGEGFEFLWAPDGAMLAGMAEGDLYLIDTQRASRKKIQLGFMSKNEKWTPGGDFLMLDDGQGEIYKMGTDGEPPSPISLKMDLAESVWDQDGRLIYYTVDEKANQAKIMAYNLTVGESTEILTKFDFPISKIARDANGALYFYNPKLENWSVLDY